MSSPGSCPRCDRALPAGSVGELCPHCQPPDDTDHPPPGTPHSPDLPAEPATATFRPPDPYSQATATDPFVAGAAVMPERPAATVLVRPEVGTTAGPEPDSRAELPPAPPGFDLLRRLGGGGMGDVFLAREYVPERLVAIKFLRASGNPVAVERFLSEVRALARVDHPHIVRFLATDFYRAQPFFTMEYASGGSLADHVSAAGPLEPLEAARIVAAAARAVHAAHAAQVLHRDLKPSNILLAADGHPRVSDFGLAKLIDQDGSATGSGPLGTPGFMPPEQINPRRGAIGPASDVYGLGATLYHLLTGKPPFVGDTPAEIVTHVERDPPVRPRSIRPEIPLALEAVVLKCLEKDPAARYPSTLALAEDLKGFLAGQRTQAPSHTHWRRARIWVSRHRREMGVALLAIVLGLMLVAIGSQFRKESPPTPGPEQLIQNEIVAGKPARLLDADGRPRSASWPMGVEVLTSSTDDGGTCHFETKNASALLLLKDAGVDSYRVKAEIGQRRKHGRVDPKANPDDNFVGLVLGHVEQHRPSGDHAHILTIFRFAEHDGADKAPVRRLLELVDVGTAGPPGFTPGSFETERAMDAVPLPLTEPGELIWRPLEVQVTPAGIWVPGRNGTRQLATAAGLAERRKSIASKLAAGPVGPLDPFPEWSPRMPIGIWAQGSWVYVRNVTIESLR